MRNKDASTEQTILPNRWIILAAAALCNALAGAMYIWSIFNGPLIAEHGWSIQATTFAYSLYLVFDFLSSFAGGFLQNHMRAKAIILMGGLFLASGWTLSGFASSLPLFYLTFGCIAGSGSGLIYNLTMSVTTKWFPDKRGLANGIVVACTGLGPLVFAPFGNFLIEHLSLTASFCACGGVFLAITLLCFNFFETPPEGWLPDGMDANGAAGTQEGESTALNRPQRENGALSRLVFDVKWSIGRHNLLVKDTDLKGLLTLPMFYVLWVMFVFASSPGLMLISHTSGIGQELVGMTASQGALQVGVMAVFSCLGRLGFGALSDRIGRFPTVNLILFLTAIDLIFFFGSSSSFTSFTISLGVVGAGFGGLMTVVPTICADFFGSQNFGQNYALLYSGYTVASFVGPMLAANVLASTGAYQLAFPLGGILAIVGLALSVVITRKLKYRKLDC